MIYTKSTRDKILLYFNPQSRMYLFDEAEEAIRYLEQGHARGKVIITVE